jgi:quercetin dioxygenase-like cupin family protein
MSKVMIVRDAEVDWREVSADWPGRAGPGEPKVVFKVLMDRAPGLPNMQRARFEPHHFEPPHTHDEDEVIHLLKGALAFGDQAIGAGDSLFVPKNTRYSLRAGGDGAEFVRVGLP